MIGMITVVMLLFLSYTAVLESYLLSLKILKSHMTIGPCIYTKVGAIDRAHARSTSARNVLLTVRMRTDRAHAPPPSEHKCIKV